MHLVIEPVAELVEAVEMTGFEGTLRGRCFDFTKPQSGLVSSTTGTPREDTAGESASMRILLRPNTVVGFALAQTPCPLSARRRIMGRVLDSRALSG